MEDRLKALEDQISGILQILQRLSTENLSNRILSLEKKVNELTEAIRQSFQDRDELMVLQRDMNKKARTQVAKLTESILQFYDEIESFQRQIEKLEEGIDQDIEVKVHNECIAIEKKLEKKIDDIQETIKSEERGTMNVDKLQQRVDDILKF